jgi:Hermansky-Pudlak syndrome 4 protein
MFNQFDDFDFVVKEEFPEVIRKSPVPLDPTPPTTLPPKSIEPPHTTTTNIKRKSLTLPIKSLVLDSEGDNKIQPQSTKASNIFDSPATRKKLGGIQLTPLMTKLTILAMSEEKSSCGFSSWGDPSGGGTPCIPELPEIQSKFRRQHSNKSDDSLDEMNESEKQFVKPVEIFICGQQNMTMLLIMEHGSAARQELIQTMVSDL